MEDVAVLGQQVVELVGGDVEAQLLQLLEQQWLCDALVIILVQQAMIVVSAGPGWFQAACGRWRAGRAGSGKRANSPSNRSAGFCPKNRSAAVVPPRCTQ